MQSSKGVPVTMDFFQHRYYRINKIFMTIIGQWPYQTIRTRCGIFALIILCIFGQMVPLIMAVVKYRDDWEFLLKCIGPSIFYIGCVVQFICATWNSQKILKLLNRIRTDWQVWAGDREVNILDKYAGQGRKITIFYAVTLYSSSVFFMVQPIIPKIIDVLLKNYSESGEFPFPVDYYHLDMQKYYFYIIMHLIMSLSVANLILTAYSTMFIVFVQHGCGIFAALGHKLERIGKNARSAETGVTVYALNQRDMNFKRLVLCIDRHNDAIEYAQLIEATYSWCFFFIVGFNMLLISISGLQIVKSSVDPRSTMRFIVLNVIAMVNLYSENYMSQILMDHSIRIHHYILNVKWYKLSAKAQKLLPLMMMRCNLPCKLTAGKISIMSIETFGVILKTSLSYFTVLRSI